MPILDPSSHTITIKLPEAKTLTVKEDQAGPGTLLMGIIGCHNGVSTDNTCQSAIELQNF